jgi:hypothetical protein
LRVKKEQKAARALSPDSWGGEETEDCWGGEEIEERVFDSDWCLRGGEGGSCEGEGSMLLWWMQQPSPLRWSMF